MAQLFPESANVLARTTIILVGAGAALGIGIAYAVQSSPLVTRQDVARAQPVPFSHKHHVAGLDLDCRYCHVYVEEGASAGIPPTHTCMTCHSQVWNEAEALQLVRDSYREEVPLRWNRVHDLPDFVYFDHSIHISKGVECKSCHGDVEQMPLMWKANTLQMQWCLECHRNPAERADADARPSDDCYACHR